MARGSAGDDDRAAIDARALRVRTARALFEEWNPTTNPELLAGQWNTLCAEDREYWLRRADEVLARREG